MDRPYPVQAPVHQGAVVPRRPVRLAIPPRLPPLRPEPRRALVSTDPLPRYERSPPRQLGASFASTASRAAANVVTATVSTGRRGSPPSRATIQFSNASVRARESLTRRQEPSPMSTCRPRIMVRWIHDRELPFFPTTRRSPVPALSACLPGPAVSTIRCVSCPFIVLSLTHRSGRIEAAAVLPSHLRAGHERPQDAWDRGRRRSQDRRRSMRAGRPRSQEARTRGRRCSRDLRRPMRAGHERSQDARIRGRHRSQEATFPGRRWASTSGREPGGGKRPRKGARRGLFPAGGARIVPRGPGGPPGVPDDSGPSRAAPAGGRGCRTSWSSA